MKYAGFICIALLAALGLWAETPRPVADSPTPHWIDVPYVHQTREGCGDAALAMLIGYWSEKQGLAGRFSDGTPAQRQQAVAERDIHIIAQDLPPGRHGISAKAMQQYLDKHGFITFAINGSWRDLENEIGKGRPLIVATRPAGDPQLHYLVITGLDPVQSLVMMNDPAGRKLMTEERAQFEKDWSATHNWLLLAVPADPRLAEEMLQR